MRSTINRLFGAGLVAGVIATTPVPSMAQDNLEEARLRKIEAEIRALQRRVFPGGDGRFFEPQIDTASQPNPATSAPTTTAVTDILVRLDALEAQLQRLTARAEENGNAIAQLDERLTALEPSPAEPEPNTEDTSATQANLAAMTGEDSDVPAAAS